LFYAEALENYLNAIKLSQKDERYIYLVDRILQKMNLTVKYSDIFGD
jgi:hypothetical protein